MKPKHQRLLIIILALVCFAAGLSLILTQFNRHLIFFYSPTELYALSILPEKTIRIGGLVQEGSVQKSEDGLTTSFILTDLENTITVQYKGILPTLFREGQGMVAKGRVDVENNIFLANELLAKHDETYMPPEVAEALKRSGKWRGE